MRIVFAGTPEFARVALHRLVVETGFDVTLVLTQPDRPAGRGMRLQPSAVKLEAESHGIPVCQPRSLRLDGRYPDDAAAARAAIDAARADVMVVAAYGLILPQWVLDRMQAGANGSGGRLGCLNIHASLLPRWRGAAPIHRAIEAGDEETGVCIMQMDAGLDTGAVLARRAIGIEHQGLQADTTGSLHDKLATIGADLLVEVLRAAEAQALAPQAQPDQGVTYADKVDKAQARLDWQHDALQLDRSVRAFNPQPGAWTQLGADVLKVWRTRALAQSPSPGTAPGTVVSVADDGIGVACGSGVLLLQQLQRAGGKRLDAADFVRGAALAPGMRLG